MHLRNVYKGPGWVHWFRGKKSGEEKKVGSHSLSTMFYVDSGIRYLAGNISYIENVCYVFYLRCFRVYVLREHTEDISYGSFSIFGVFFSSV